MRKIAPQRRSEQSRSIRAASNPAPLQGKGLILGRALWALLVFFDLGILVYTYPAFISQQYTFCTDITRVTCGEYQLFSTQMAALQRFGLSLDAYAAYVIVLDILITLAFLLVGALLFWHRSNDRMGLFVSFFLITFGCLGISDIHMSAISGTPPLAVEIFGDLVLFLQWPALGFFFYLFPDGRFVPRWSWLLSFLFVIQIGFYFLPYPYDINHWPPVLNLLEALIVYGSTIGTQVYRYLFVATKLQRQQIKWLTFGFAATFLLSLGFSAAPFIFPELNARDSWYPLLSPLSLVSSYIFLPGSIGIALLRYRLWDIDTLINRALVYALLTGTLLAIYVGLVFGGQALLVGIIGGADGVMLVISTLVVAGLFQPLRHRIQGIIDRRFYRPKYDAQRTFTTFRTTLQSEVDLHQLQTRLLDVVVETMQPEHASLWLCQMKGERAETLDI